MTATDIHDDLLAELRRANPVQAHALPSAADPGPARTLDAIFTDADADADANVNARPLPRRERRYATSFAADRRRRWIGAAAAAAAIVVAAATGIVLFDTGTGRDATATVHDAVTTTIAVSDSALWETSITFDFDDFDEPWQLAMAGSMSDGNSEVRWLASPGVPDRNIPPMEAQTMIIVDGQAYRLGADGAWEGPTPASTAPIQSNLTFGVAIDDLGDLYDFTTVGDEELDGIAVAHYRTTTTPVGAGAGMLMTLGMGLMAAGQESIEQLDSVQLDVWVDGDDLIRSVGYSATIDGTGTFTVVTDWNGFGEAPTITTPVN